MNMSDATRRVLHGEFARGRGTREEQEYERIMTGAAWQVQNYGRGGTTGATLHGQH